MKTAIVCEGGGMRGTFTAGVLQAFMEGGFVADELVGVSAGASNGMSYVSAQQGRGLRTNVDYVGDKRYLSVQSLLRTGSIFGMDFVFGEIPETLDPYDFDAFYASPCRFFAGATDLETGKITFFGKEQIGRDLMPVRASCSMPLLAPTVEISGRKYLDGGIADPIPLDKALEDGCERIIVVLTRERGFVKKRQGMRSLYHAKYRAWPNFVKTMDLRHLVYNRTLAQVAHLEQKGRVIVVAPPQPLKAGRLAQDREELLVAYYEGMKAGQQALQKL